MLHPIKCAINLPSPLRPHCLPFPLNPRTTHPLGHAGKWRLTQYNKTCSRYYNNTLCSISTRFSCPVVTFDLSVIWPYQCLSRPAPPLPSHFPGQMIQPPCLHSWPCNFFIALLLSSLAHLLRTLVLQRHHTAQICNFTPPFVCHDILVITVFLKKNNRNDPAHYNWF